MRVVQVRSAQRCAVCHDALAGAVACVTCNAQGHAECWAELGRCSSLGCVASAGLQARPKGAPRWRGRVPLLLDSAVAGAANAVGFVGLVGLIAAVVLVNLGGQSCRSRCHRVAADMKAISDALDLYKVDCGHYPDSLHALWTRPPGERRWGGPPGPGWKRSGPEPYLRDYPPRDPWGNVYIYRYESGARFEIVSLGADGALGGQDEAADLSSRTINNQDAGAP